MLAQVAKGVDVLLLCGDLTDHGLPEEAQVLASELNAVRVPMIGVLGNHDYESGKQDEVRDVLVAAGVTMLDGDACEVKGVGFAGVKGFAGGFGRALGPWGENAIKDFVREAVNEALKLEAALARLRTPHRIGVLPLRPHPRDGGRRAAGDLSLPRLQPAERTAVSLQGDGGLSRPRPPRIAGGQDRRRHSRFQRGAAAAAATLPDGPRAASSRWLSRPRWKRGGGAPGNRSLMHSNTSSCQ